MTEQFPENGPKNTPRALPESAHTADTGLLRDVEGTPDETNKISRDELWRKLRSASREADRLHAEKAGRRPRRNDEYEDMLKQAVEGGLCPQIIQDADDLRGIINWFDGNTMGMASLPPPGVKPDSSLGEINRQQFNKAFLEILRQLHPTVEFVTDDVFALLRERDNIAEKGDQTIDRDDLTEDILLRIRSTVNTLKGARGKEGIRMLARSRATNEYINALETEFPLFMKNHCPPRICVNTTLPRVGGYLTEAISMLSAWLVRDGVVEEKRHVKICQKLTDACIAVIEKYDALLTGNQSQADGEKLAQYLGNETFPETEIGQQKTEEDGLAVVQRSPEPPGMKPDAVMEQIREVPKSDIEAIVQRISDEQDETGRQTCAALLAELSPDEIAQRLRDIQPYLQKRRELLDGLPCNVSQSQFETYQSELRVAYDSAQPAISALPKQLRKVVRDGVRNMLHALEEEGKMLFGKSPEEDGRDPWGDIAEILKPVTEPLPTYPPPALVPEQTLEERWREMGEKQKLEGQRVQTFLAFFIDELTATLAKGFIDACRQTDFTFKNDEERQSASRTVKRWIASCTSRIHDVVREACRNGATAREMLEHTHADVIKTILALKVEEGIVPTDLARLLEGHLIIGIHDALTTQWHVDALSDRFIQNELPLSVPPSTDPFDILPIQTVDEARTDQEKIDSAIGILKNGLLCGMLRNICAVVPRKKVTINGGTERYAVSSHDFSLKWIPNMERAIEGTLNQYLERTPRHSTTVDKYIDRMFGRQNILSLRAGHKVENTLKENAKKHGQPAPEEKLFTAMRGSIALITRGKEENVPSTMEEFEAFMVRELLGGRSPGDGLFPQEAEKVRQWCINTLNTGENMEEQLQRHLPALGQLAAEFDRDVHADLTFRRALSDEALLEFTKPTAAQVLLQKGQRDREEEQKLREFAGIELPPHVAKLKLLNKENEEWIAGWPAKHRRDDDVIGFALIRMWHDYACAYIKRCEEQGKELPGLALATERAESVQAARENKVISIEGGEQKEEEGKPTRKTLQQDTKRVWAFLLKREAELDHIIGGAQSKQEDLHHGARGPLALLWQFGKEAKELEMRLGALPDRTAGIAELQTRLASSRSERDGTQSLLDDLQAAEEGESTGRMTVESLAREAGNLLARIRLLGNRANEDKKHAEESLANTEADCQKAEDELDEYASRGGSDQLVTNPLNKTINDAKEEKEKARNVINDCSQRRDETDLLELEIVEGLERLGDPAVEDGEIGGCTGDFGTLLKAFQSDVKAFSAACSQFARLSKAAEDHTVLVNRAEELGKQVTDDEKRLKTLKDEQKQRERLEVRLTEIRDTMTVVRRVLEQKPFSPEPDAEQR